MPKKTIVINAEGIMQTALALWPHLDVPMGEDKAKAAVDIAKDLMSYAFPAALDLSDTITKRYGPRVEKAEQEALAYQLAVQQSVRAAQGAGPQGRVVPVGMMPGPGFGGPQA